MNASSEVTKVKQKLQVLPLLVELHFGLPNKCDENIDLKIDKD